MINEDEVKKWLVIAEKCGSNGEEYLQNGGEVFERLSDLVAILRELNEFISTKVKSTLTAQLY